MLPRASGAPAANLTSERVADVRAPWPTPGTIDNQLHGLVMTYGKVASTSLAECTLPKLLGVKQGDAFCSVRKPQYGRLCDTHDHGIVADFVRKALPGAPLVIIMAVRNPFTHVISGVFEQMPKPSKWHVPPRSASPADIREAAASTFRIMSHAFVGLHQPGRGWFSQSANWLSFNPLRLLRHPEYLPMVNTDHLLHERRASLPALPRAVTKTTSTTLHNGARMATAQLRLGDHPATLLLLRFEDVISWPELLVDYLPSGADTIKGCCRRCQPHSPPTRQSHPPTARQSLRCTSPPIFKFTEAQQQLLLRAESWQMYSANESRRMVEDWTAIWRLESRCDGVATALDIYRVGAPGTGRGRPLTLRSGSDHSGL